MEAAKLKSYLECPICFLLPVGKILPCVNSHQICESCFYKLTGAKNCPQGCEFDIPPRRARVSEAMIENSDLDQNCSNPGCDVEMKKDGMAIHELKCIFRTVPWPNTKCQKEILFKNIDMHIRDKHKVIILTVPKIRTSLRKASLDKHRWNWKLFSYQEKEEQFYGIFVKRNDHCTVIQLVV